MDAHANRFHRRVMVQMARDKLMPRASAEPMHYPASKAIFPELFKELADDVRLWLDAELALAKAEAGLRLRGYATGLIMALLGASLFIVAMVVLAQACVSALVPPSLLSLCFLRNSLTGGASK